MGQVISLLVENKAGVLSRIVGLFSQRGYNIESLNVAPALDAEVSRITLTTRTDLQGTEQVVKQLSKLIDVVKVTPYDSDTQVIREMALVRVQVNEENRAEVLALSEVFRARVIDVSAHNYIFELTGQSGKIDAFLENVEAYGIREIHRTGELTLGRGKSGRPKDASGRRRPILVEDETD
jgi:acetolactate synthase-1/3 small subunit